MRTHVCVQVYESMYMCIIVNACLCMQIFLNILTYLHIRVLKISCLYYKFIICVLVINLWEAAEQHTRINNVLC